MSKKVITSKNTSVLGSSKAFKYNPFDPEFKANPYPIYHRLRTEDPIHLTKKFGGEEWLLTRFADVHAVAKDHRFCPDDLPQRIKDKSFYLQEGKDFNELSLTTSKWLFFLEEPDHTRLRGLVSKVFSPREVQSLHPQIQKIVDDLINSVQEAGTMDVMSDFARLLPTSVTAKIVGVPNENLSKLIQWGRDLFYVFDQPVSLKSYEYMNKVALEFKEFFRDLIVEREKRPKEDLISNLIAARDQERKLSQDEILAFCAMFFTVGQETTENMLGNSVFALLSHPEQMEKLKQDPTIIKNAIEELIRYDSPVQIIARIAKEDVEIGGKTIRAGGRVHLCLGAANRDPAKFSQPDILNLTRSETRGIPFGYGMHHCLGAALARAQGQIAINRLVQRLPDLKLNTDRVEWRKNIVLRGLKSLPVTFTSQTA